MKGWIALTPLDLTHEPKNLKIWLQCSHIQAVLPNERTDGSIITFSIQDDVINVAESVDMVMNLIRSSYENS